MGFLGILPQQGICHLVAGGGDRSLIWITLTGAVIDDVKYPPLDTVIDARFPSGDIIKLQFKNQ